MLRKITFIVSLLISLNSLANEKISCYTKYNKDSDTEIYVCFNQELHNVRPRSAKKIGSFGFSIPKNAKFYSFEKSEGCTEGYYRSVQCKFKSNRYNRELIINFNSDYACNGKDRKECFSFYLDNVLFE